MRTISNDSRKCIGIIGGMGPEATCLLFAKIIKYTPASIDQEHLHLIVDSDPSTPDRTEARFGRAPSPLPWLVRSATRLVSAGAEVLVIPCVSAHAFLAELRTLVNGPIVSAITTVSDEVLDLQPAVDRVGLLATDGTLKFDLFGLLRRQMALLIPQDDDQKELMMAIYGCDGIKTKGLNAVAQGVMLKCANRLRQRGAKAIVAGCTEVSVALNAQQVGIPVVDALDCLAKSAVREAMQSYENR